MTECLTSGLEIPLDIIVQRATTANRGGDTEPFENIAMDMMSLGQRFDWEQLKAFIANVNDPRTLELLAEDARNAGDRLPVPG